MLEETEDITINSFRNYGFSYIYKEERNEEKEYIFEHSSKEDVDWFYTLTYYWPSNDINIIKEHKYSKNPVWYSVFEGVINKIDDLKHIKRMVLI